MSEQRFIMDGIDVTDAVRAAAMELIRTGAFKIIPGEDTERGREVAAFIEAELRAQAANVPTRAMPVMDGGMVTFDWRQEPPKQAADRRKQEPQP